MNRPSIFPFLVAGFLTACGGGSGGGETAPATAVSVPTPDTGTPATGAAAIKVPDGFNFATDTTLQIEVRLQGQVAPRTYLTVCADGDNGSAPNYDRCILKAPVEAGALSKHVQLPNDVESLTATLWSLRPPQPIQSIRWERFADEQAVIVVD